MSMVDVVPERAVIYYLLCQSDDAPLVNEKHTYDAQGWSGAGSYLYGNRADSGQTCFMTSTCALALATRRPASRRSDVCPWRPAYDRCVHAWQDAHVVHVLRGTQAAMPGRAGRQAHGGAGAPREHARSGGVVGRPLRVATALGGAARRRRTTVRAPPPRRRRPRASAAAFPRSMRRDDRKRQPAADAGRGGCGLARRRCARHRRAHVDAGECRRGGGASCERQHTAGGAGESRRDRRSCARQRWAARWRHAALGGGASAARWRHAALGGLARVWHGRPRKQATQDDVRDARAGDAGEGGGVRQTVGRTRVGVPGGAGGATPRAARRPRGAALPAHLRARAHARSATARLPRAGACVLSR